MCGVSGSHRYFGEPLRAPSGLKNGAANLEVLFDGETRVDGIRGAHVKDGHSRMFPVRLDNCYVKAVDADGAAYVDVHKSIISSVELVTASLARANAALKQKYGRALDQWRYIEDATSARPRMYQPSLQSILRHTEPLGGPQ